MFKICEWNKGRWYNLSGISWHLPRNKREKLLSSTTFMQNSCDPKYMWKVTFQYISIFALGLWDKRSHKQ